MRAVIRESLLREGIQALDLPIALDDRVAIANRLVASKVDYVEVTAYVPPLFTSQFDGRVELLRRIERGPGTKLAAFVPNQRGFDDALDDRERGHGVDALGLIVSASETHNVRNLRRGTEEALQSIGELAPAASAAGFEVFCYLSAAFGYAEPLDTADRVPSLASTLYELGCEVVVLSDTTGVADRATVRSTVESIGLPRERLFLHMHNHRLRALSNSLAGWDLGVRGFDGTVGGVGGYPQKLASDAPVLSQGGNVDTLALIHGLAARGAEVDQIDVSQLEAALEQVTRLAAVEAWSTERCE